MDLMIEEEKQPEVSMELACQDGEEFTEVKEDEFNPVHHEKNCEIGFDRPILKQDLCQKFSFDSCLKFKKSTRVAIRPFLSKFECEKNEIVEIRKLRRLLSFCKRVDESSYKMLIFYDQCYVDRFAEYAFLPVHYRFSSEWRTNALGRVYGYSRSVFNDLVNYCSLQSMKKQYRAYLCYDNYWDIDIQNAHPSILVDLLVKAEIKPPHLLQEYVQSRDNVISRLVSGLFEKSLNLSQNEKKERIKSLMLRFLYGGSLCTWLKSYNLKAGSLVPEIQDAEVEKWVNEGKVSPEKLERLKTETYYNKIALVNELLTFQRELPSVIKKLIYHENHAEILAAMKNSPKKYKMFSILSLILQDQERRILKYADKFLSKGGYSLDVLIHDGGLLRKNEKSHHFPESLIENLNKNIFSNLKLQNVRFVRKEFDLSLCDLIDKEPEYSIEYTYLYWKFYLENYRDLCYITKEQAWCLADNLQTNFYKSKEALRGAMGIYKILRKTVPTTLTKRDEEAKEIIGTTNLPTVWSQNISELTRTTAMTTVSSTHSQPLIQTNRNIPDTYSDSGRSSLCSSLYYSPSERKFIMEKEIPFIDIWFDDNTQRRFDMICFSQKTFAKMREFGYLTPAEHSKFFEPKIRYVFHEWELLSVQPEDHSSHSLFLELLEGLFPAKEVKEYIINWLAHLFQFPDERIVGTCLVLISRIQGSGKSTLIEAILDLTKRFGRLITNVKEQLFNNFTTVMENHVLLVIDDSNSTVMRKHYEDLKALITTRDARIREMYISERQTISNVRFLIVSNNTENILLEENSRRFAVFEAAGTLFGNFERFTSWKSYWSDLSNRRATLDFFLEHKIPKNWHPEACYPESNLKRDMELSGLSPLATFISSFALKAEKNMQEGKPWIDVRAKQLLKSFYNWCQENFPSHLKHRDCPNKNSFPCKLLALGVENTKRAKMTDPKTYRDAIYYRILLRDQVKKAINYSIEPLEEKYVPKDPEEEESLLKGNLEGQEYR